MVEAGSQDDAGVLTAKVEQLVSELLKEHCKALGADKEHELTLNPDKMTVTPYRSTSAQNNLSALMEMLQEAISGTLNRPGF